jgi:hypothetical protein
MAKNPLITSEVKRVITKIYFEHPDWRAKEIRDEVETQLHEQNLHFKPGWPGLSAVQKELTTIRKRESERPSELDELDKPWSVGSLNKHPIPPESLPAVMRVYYAERLDQRTFEYLKKAQNLLTIRQALWIARLATVYKDPVTLVYIARFYAMDERVAEVQGKSLETFAFDFSIYSYFRDEIWHNIGPIPEIKNMSWSDTYHQQHKEA